MIRKLLTSVGGFYSLCRGFFVKDIVYNLCLVKCILLPLIDVDFSSVCICFYCVSQVPRRIFYLLLLLLLLTGSTFCFVAEAVIL